MRVGPRSPTGADLDRLFITTSRENLPDDVEPASGSVYAADVGVRGWRRCRCEGEGSSSGFTSHPTAERSLWSHREFQSVRDGEPRSGCRACRVLRQRIITPVLSAF